MSTQRPPGYWSKPTRGWIGVQLAWVPPILLYLVATRRFLNALLFALWGVLLIVLWRVQSRRLAHWKTRRQGLPPPNPFEYVPPEDRWHFRRRR